MDTKEAKTVQLNIKVSEKFKREVENYAHNSRQSQVKVIETAFYGYVETKVRKEVMEGQEALYKRLDPYFRKHPEFHKPNIMFAVFDGFSPKAMINICDPTQCNDDTFFDIVDVKIEVSQKRGEFNRYGWEPKNTIETASTMTVINEGIMTAPTVINEPMTTGATK